MKSDSLWFFRGTLASLDQCFVKRVHTSTECPGIGARGRVAGHSHIQLAVVRECSHCQTLISDKGQDPGKLRGAWRRAGGVPLPWRGSEYGRRVRAR